LAANRLGPWATTALIFWVLILLALPISVIGFAQEDFLRSSHVSPSMHSLIEGFCSVVAFEIFGVLTFARFYRKDASIVLFALAFLAMGVFDGMHAIVSPKSYFTLFVALHTTSSVCGAVLLLAGVSVKVWSIDGQPSAKATRMLLAAGMCLIAAILYHAVMLQIDPGRTNEAAFSVSIYQIHNISTVCYVLSAMGLLYYYWAKQNIAALIIGSMLAVLAESAYLFQFSTMWDVDWWLWHYVKAAFYFGMLTTASVALIFTIRSAETSRLSLARANVKLTRAKRQLAEFNSELYARNEMVREAVACFSLENVLHAFSRSIQAMIPQSRCEFVIYVPSDEVGEVHRSVQAEWQSLPISVQPHPESPITAGEVVSFSSTDLSPERACINSPLVSERIELGLVRIDAPSKEIAVNLEKIRAAVLEIGPLVQSALRNFNLAQEARFRKSLSAAVGKTSGSLDSNKVLAIACQEIVRLLGADWACVIEGTSAPFTLAATSNAIGVAPDLMHAEHFAAFVSEMTASSEIQPTSWMLLPALGDRFSTAIGLPISYDETVDRFLIAFRHANVEFSQTTISKGELFVRQVAVAYSNAVNYRRVVDVNRELEVQKEIRARSERLATLGQLAACVAHEVRNPLGAISNCVSILGDDRNDQGTVDNVLEIIRGEVARLDRLTRDFLAIGSRPSKMSVVTLSEMLDRVVRAVHQYINYERLPVQLESHFIGERRALLFDSDGFEIVLWNLVLNAVQAMNGCGRVQIALRQRSAHIFLAVVDEGRGIAVDDRQTIFEPFLSTRASGAGLGLVIISRYMAQWGGKIKIKSTLEKGSAFLMHIPLPLMTETAKQTA
jgi:signal transduction histidine kinase